MFTTRRAPAPLFKSARRLAVPALAALLAACSYNADLGRQQGLLVDPAGKEELTEDIWDKVFAVNVKGQFLCAQAAARAMLADDQGGVIVNMASESGSE